MSTISTSTKVFQGIALFVCAASAILYFLSLDPHFLEPIGLGVIVFLVSMQREQVIASLKVTKGSGPKRKAAQVQRTVYVTAGVSALVMVVAFVTIMAVK